MERVEFREKEKDTYQAQNCAAALPQLHDSFGYLSIFRTAIGRRVGAPRRAFRAAQGYNEAFSITNIGSVWCANGTGLFESLKSVKKEVASRDSRGG